MMALTAAHARLILEIEAALDGAPGVPFAEALLEIVRCRMGDAGVEYMKSVDARAEPLLAMQRAIGEVTATIDIASKVERIAKRYRDSGEAELAEAFELFAVKLVQYAKKKGQPVMDQADERRADNARRN